MEGFKITDKQTAGDVTRYSFEVDGDSYSTELDGEQLELDGATDRLMRHAAAQSSETRYLDPQTSYTSEQLAEWMGCSTWTITRYARAGLLERRDNVAGSGYVYRVLRWVRVADLRNKSTRKEALKAIARSEGVPTSTTTSTDVVPMTTTESSVATVFEEHKRTITQDAAARLVSTARQLKINDDGLIEFLTAKLDDFDRRSATYNTGAIVRFCCQDMESWSANRQRQPPAPAAPRRMTRKPGVLDWIAIRSFFAVVRTGEHVVDSHKLIKRHEYDNATIAIYRVTSQSFRTSSGLTGRTEVELAIDDSIRVNGAHDRALSVAYLRRITETQAELDDDWQVLDVEAQDAIRAMIQKLVAAWVDS